MKTRTGNQAQLSATPATVSRYADSLPGGAHPRKSDRSRVRRALPGFVKLACLAVSATALLLSAGAAPAEKSSYLIAGEPEADSIILQARIGTPGDFDFSSLSSDIAGAAGEGMFEIAADAAFADAIRSPLLRAHAGNDFMLKARIAGLQPGRDYHYRVVWNDGAGPKPLPDSGRFRTLDAPDHAGEVGFVMVSCMNYEKFYGIGSTHTQAGASKWAVPAAGADRADGFPAFRVIKNLRPAFWIGNGDNVYYDSPSERPDLRAKSVGEMRAKWHRQFAVPSVRDALASFPTYWLKDDHDYRFNDSDATDRVHAEPSHEDGISVFRGQVPVVDPQDSDAVTYRTRRVSRDLQLWFLEGRDYRSPNDAPPGPGKTLWGARQLEWLKDSLSRSDAAFLVIVSPTPIVGPDDSAKRDNHANPAGFQAEGDEFVAWLVANGLIGRVFVLNGDRHWQYHSIHPSGLEEFSSGALNSQNARVGPAAGVSTDPSSRIVQPYCQPIPVGGFLHVVASPSSADGRPSLLFQHWDERGELLYAVRRYAPRKP